MQVVVIGSGPSGVHAALTLLRLKISVIMIDVGFEEPDVTHPDLNFKGVKKELNDPIDYFLGDKYDGILFPGSKIFYKSPPSRLSIIQESEKLTPWTSSTFSPYVSLAKGGLANMWAANVSTFNDKDLNSFLIDYSDLEEGYCEVADRIGVSGCNNDDLSSFYPTPYDLLPPIRLNPHDWTILNRYSKVRNTLNKKYRFFLGRARLAVLTENFNSRFGCTYSSRCLWGCGQGALYHPKFTLEECKKYSNFKYLSGKLALYFNSTPNSSPDHLRSVSVLDLSTQKLHEISGDVFISAAGTINSTGLLLRTFRQRGLINCRSRDFLDHHYVKLPFINFPFLGKKQGNHHFQFNTLSLGMIEDDDWKNEIYVHGQLATMTSLLTHPLVNSLPFESKTAVSLFRNIRSSLGSLMLMFPDFPKKNSYLELIEDKNSPTRDAVHIVYGEYPGKQLFQKKMFSKAVKCLRKLGCIAAPEYIIPYAQGTGNHYAGTIPMSKKKELFTVNKDCRSHDFNNIYFVDGSFFPFLPAKNITFTLMANAVRVARKIAEKKWSNV